MSNIIETIRPYAKFVVSLIGAVGVTTLVALTSGGATPETIITAAVSLLTAISVYGVPNEPKQVG